MTRAIGGGCTFRDASGQCPEIAVRRGRCKEHQRKPWTKREGTPRAYDSEWDKLSARFRREHPYCWCGAPATATDHIIPISEGGARLAWGNLQSLCDPHHDEKTQQEARRGRSRRPTD